MKINKNNSKMLLKGFSLYRLKKKGFCFDCENSESWYLLAMFLRLNQFSNGDNPHISTTCLAGPLTALSFGAFMNFVR